MSTEQTPAQKRLHAAMMDAVNVAIELKDAGREDRVAGLAVGIDLGVSACFLFSVTERDYDQATKMVRQAITHATREEE